MAGKGHRGPPTKLTHALSRRICESIVLGVPIEHACAGVGVTARTLRLWRRAGETGDKRFEWFVRDLAVAKAQLVQSLVSSIHIAGRDPERWQAAAWLAERVDRENFGFKGQLNMVINAEREFMINVAEEVLGAAQAAILLQALIDRGSGSAPPPSEEQE